MLHQAVAFALLVILVILVTVGEAVAAIDCQKFIVTAADGYANVRSAPQVRTNNVVATLPSGTGIGIIKKNKGWFNINSPVQGWIAVTQITRFPCNSDYGLTSNLGLSTIARLGNQAVAGDRNSAETFIKMSRGVDGSLAEAYAEAIATWASHDPASLLSVLNEQPQAVQRAALELLDFSFGAGQSAERQQFETALSRFSAEKPIVREWRSISQRGQ